MIRICPSVLNADQSALAREIERVGKEADFIHLDIMDDRFVPNFTYDAKQTLDIVSSSVLPIDLHLMVEDGDYWGPYYASMADAGVFSVTVHLEAVRDLGPTLQSMGEHGVRRGVALKPGTPVQVLREYLGEIEMILIMTVEPGFGGQSFMHEMMPKVREARTMLEEAGRSVTWLQVDGGISLATIGEATAAGADTFVAGSAVYRSEDPAKMVRELRAKALAHSQ